ncbi:pyridine nucleotide-disulfide oxidoreductase (plasmid) [Deinococcus aetherius]|uniref:Pyridine nucleotide-disulfide oxidoreductase n=1 Tax=Deinococcus aetherius TaxID=200252 RepID=A0ABN6RM11_9DEIO|nr:FAD-dependent oxidoreductase [Deinococcus aetherius]BDP44356.1 pyridine nucleotide-disulfide oxidoreductase [Deinococcus aetherius]
MPDLYARRTADVIGAGQARPRPLRLLLVGGGHANVALLKAARRWTRRGVRVTLVSDARHLYASGMTPESLGGVYSAEDVRIDLLRWCLVNHVAFVQARVTGLDVVARTARTSQGDILPCDLAVFDIGATNPLRDRAGSAVLTKPLHHIGRLRAWLEGGSSSGPPRSLVVVGGGPAGTEVLLNVSARWGRRTGPGALGLTLVHPGGRLMPQFAPGLGRRAEHLLRGRGVRVLLNTRVERVEEGAVVLEGGERLPGDVVLWATGTRGQALFGEAGLPVDGQGYVQVDRRLRVLGQPWLFAAGDCAVMEGRRLDRSGVNAVAQGLVLRGHLDRLVNAWQAGRDPAGVSLSPFRPYPVAPYLISTGTPEGMLALGPRVGLRGRPLLWCKHLADRVWVGRYRFPA